MCEYDRWKNRLYEKDTGYDVFVDIMDQYVTDIFSSDHQYHLTFIQELAEEFDMEVDEVSDALLNPYHNACKIYDIAESFYKKEWVSNLVASF